MTDPRREKTLAVWAALALATERGTSGVSVKGPGEGRYWTLVVPDPPNGWPIMTSGK